MSDSKINVLVFGAGKGQVPLIQKFQKYGCHVIAVSPDGPYPGLSIADEIVYEDVKDEDKIYEAVKNRGIKAVASDQSDIVVPFVARLAQKLGLKNITEKVATRFRDKYEMRRSACAAGVRVPEFCKAYELDRAIESVRDKIGYPCMIKPTDNDSSKGVFKINSENELVDKFDISRSYSRSGAVIIEQFVSGKEYVVEAFTTDHKTRNLIVGHRDYFDIPNTFIPSATVFSDADLANTYIEEKVKEANLKIVKSFGLPFGLTHGEYLYNEKEDTVYLVEIAARGGGVFISSDLIPAACGVDALDLLVKELIGIDYDKNIVLQQGSSAYFCFLTTEGVVESIEGVDEVKKMDGVILAYLDTIGVGMKTAPPIDKASRKWPILVKGKTKDDCYAVMKKVKAVLKIKIRNGEKVSEVIWA